MESLYIIIPVYNEEKNLAHVVDDWYPVLKLKGISKDSRLVLVNDGSTDNSNKIALELCKSRPQIVVLNKNNGGHGSAVIFGYRYALEKKIDYVFQTDSDGQTLSWEFAEFWELRKKYDAVLGMRSQREDGISRIFVENVLRFIVKVIFGVVVPDTNAPYRLMRTTLAGKYIDKLPEDFNLPNVMLTVYFSYYHEKLAFKKITFRPRQGGKNSIDFRRIIKIGWKALFDFHALRKNMRKDYRRNGSVDFMK